MSTVFQQPPDAGIIEDKTVFVHVSRSGEDVVEHEVIERTDFSTAYPRTERTVRRHHPLACGHAVDMQQFVYAGMCQRKKWRASFRWEICGDSACAICFVQCPRCSIFVSSHCCAQEFEGKFFCKDCWRFLLAKRAALHFYGDLVRP